MGGMIPGARDNHGPLSFGTETLNRKEQLPVGVRFTEAICHQTHNS